MRTIARPGAEIQIRAHCLTALGDSANDGAFMASGLMGQKLAGIRGGGTKLSRHQWRERDLQRAIAVARRSKLLNYRIELAPDGTIAIVVGK